MGSAIRWGFAEEIGHLELAGGAPAQRADAAAAVHIYWLAYLQQILERRSVEPRQSAESTSWHLEMYEMSGVQVAQ